MVSCSENDRLSLHVYGSVNLTTAIVNGTMTFQASVLRETLQLDKKMINMIQHDLCPCNVLQLNYSEVGLS